MVSMSWGESSEPVSGCTSGSFSSSAFHRRTVPTSRRKEWKDPQARPEAAKKAAAASSTAGRSQAMRSR